MSQETFDPITRSIRSVETEARSVIASAESAIATMRKKRNVTVAAYQQVFDKLGACLQDTNQIHDSVVAHAHLVADNIANRSKRQVMTVRTSLLETANQMIDHCRPSLFPGVYDPTKAFDAITSSLQKHGLMNDQPDISKVALAPNAIGYIATYQLEQYTFSVVVTVTCPEVHTLGNGNDEIRVSVWEDRLPPIWDTSYHDAQSETVRVSQRKGNSLGSKWTRQTDAALTDYVASILSRDVVLRTTDMAVVPTDPKEPTNRYGTQMGRPLRTGSEQFDWKQDKEILTSAITGTETGDQGEFIINLNPMVVNKVTLARYVIQIIQGYSAQGLEARTRLNRKGFYQILVDSKVEGERVQAILDRVMNG